MTDAVATIVGQLDAAETTTLDNTVETVEVVRSDTAPAELPALTRRELREREAKAAARPTLFAASRAPKSAPAVAPAAPILPESVATVAQPIVAQPNVVPSRRAARPTGRRSGTVAARSKSSTRPVSSPKPGARRHILRKLISVSAMAGVGLILVATTVPANAFMRPDASSASSVVTAADTQELTVESAASSVITRDGYTVVPLSRQTSGGLRNFSFVNNPNGAIQWPFPDGSPITSGFGARHVSGCGFCSTNHQGLDFTPGSGTPIHSIGPGVVSKVEVSGGGLGNSVVIDHVVNGQKVQSVYGHMQYGSIQVAVGQTVVVGQIIGAVGSTGASTGAHLHLEIHLEGTPVDPFAWLQANSG